MRLLCITDLHGKSDALKRILAETNTADAILLGGDITHFGSPQDVQQIVSTIESLGKPVLAVAGNCDSAAIDQRLAQIGVSLHGRGVALESIGLQGVSGIPPWNSRMYQFTEEELAEALQAGYAQLPDGLPHAVLAHVPPRKTAVDRIFLGCHVGSTALREFVQRTKPRLVICGHVHEGRGIDKIGPTTIVNCGRGGADQYAIVEVDDEIGVELCQA